MRDHAFVDESKRAGLVLAVALVPAREVDAARRAVRGLLLPGQARMHFTKESPARRRIAVAAFRDLTSEVWVYDACGLTGHAARDNALAAVAEDAVKAGLGRLVVERDDSLVTPDRRVLDRVWRRHRTDLVPEGVHLTARAEPLLALPDAVAWCWTRDSRWRAVVSGMVTRVTTL